MSLFDLYEYRTKSFAEFLRSLDLNSFADALQVDQFPSDINCPDMARLTYFGALDEFCITV